jgi:hypothetical protein
MYRVEIYHKVLMDVSATVAVVQYRHCRRLQQQIQLDLAVASSTRAISILGRLFVWCRNMAEAELYIVVVVLLDMAKSTRDGAWK